MDLIIFGIASCDACRRARRWLSESGLEHRFVDLRADGIAPDTIAEWVAEAGARVLVNRRSTTWRQLGPAERARADDDRVVDLLAAHPTLIKRPVVVLDGAVSVGFDEATRRRLATVTAR